VQDGVTVREGAAFAADEELGFLDYGIVEDFIRNICSEYAVTRLAFDPFQMTRTQQLLSAEGLPAETFPQNDARMVVASQGLYDLVAEKHLRHGGDENLRMEMLNAGIRETARGWRLEKRKSNGHIDGIVALAMACQLAQWELELGEARVIVI
jgi:phage terminase large subunit-like protein